MTLFIMSSHSLTSSWQLWNFCWKPGWTYKWRQRMSWQVWLANCFTAAKSFLLVGPSYLGYWKQRGWLTWTTIQLPWTVSSELTSIGGTQWSKAGMERATSSLSMLVMCPWMPRNRVDITLNLESGHTTLPQTSSSRLVFLLRWKNGTSVTWSYWPTFWPATPGPVPGMVRKSRCSHSMKPVIYSCFMAGPGHLAGSPWVMRLLDYNSRLTSGCIQQEYQPPKMCCQMLYPEKGNLGSWHYSAPSVKSMVFSPVRLHISPEALKLVSGSGSD
jgi:hypothetical protein